jgi:RNA polymerase sigma-70 factor (ECF subfamily)
MYINDVPQSASERVQRGSGITVSTSIMNDRSEEASMRCSQAIPALSTSRVTCTQAQSDDTLLVLIAEGDRHAMQILFRRHNVRVYRFILRFVNDRSLAEDVTSEVFLDVWQQAGRFEGRSQVSTWLLAIARNKALSARRRYSPEPLDQDAIEFIEDPAETPEAAMGGTQRSELIRQSLTQLTPAHREIIDLVYYQEKSVSEAAEIVGIPQNTVKTRMFHARKRMAMLLDQAGLEKTAA